MKVEFGDISRSTRYVTVKLIGVEPNNLQINVITSNNKYKTLDHFSFRSQPTKVDFGSLFGIGSNSCSILCLVKKIHWVIEDNFIGPHFGGKGEVQDQQFFQGWLPIT